MNGPPRMALAAIALGFGVFWAGAPIRATALAQVAEAAATETQPAEAPPATAAPTADGVDAPAIGAQPVETPPAATAPTADGVDASAIGAQPAETPPAATAPTAGGADAPAIGAQPSETPPAAAIPTADGVDVSAVGPQPDETSPLSSAPADGVDASAAAPQLAEPLSGIAAELAGWIVASSDNGGRPFVIVDKLAADAFTFDADGRLQGAAPVLVGLTRGDDSTPGVGDRELSAIPPEDRTTPAGRFVASFGSATGHRKVLWVDYQTAISLHPVITTNPAERRLERLQSPAPEDRRITYGCINVPTAFYKDVVLKAFAGGSGVVYILPDTRSVAEVFPAFAALVPKPAVGDQPAQPATGVVAAAEPNPQGAPEAAPVDGAGPPAAPSSDAVSTPAAGAPPDTSLAAQAVSQ